MRKHKLMKVKIKKSIDMRDCIASAGRPRTREIKTANKNRMVQAELSELGLQAFVKTQKLAIN